MTGSESESETETTHLLVPSSGRCTTAVGSQRIYCDGLSEQPSDIRWLRGPRTSFFTKLLGWGGSGHCFWFRVGVGIRLGWRGDGFCDSLFKKLSETNFDCYVPFVCFFYFP